MTHSPAPLLLLALAGMFAAVAPPASEAPDPMESVLPAGDLVALQERVARERGVPLLINFWATWCLPCIHEIPPLNEMREDLQPQGAHFLAVSLDPLVYRSIDEARSKVAQVIREESFRLPMFLYDGDQEALQQRYELPGSLPQTILLGPDGKVLDRVEGRLNPAEVERLVDRIRHTLEVPQR